MFNSLSSLHFIVCFWIVFPIGACLQVDPDGFETVSAIPYQDELLAHKVSIEGGIELLYPFHILNVDDQYLVITEVRENDFLHVLNLPDLHFQYSWGQHGRGPDEFMFFPYFINQKEKKLHFYDAMLQQNRVFRIGETTLENVNQFSLSYTGQMDPLNGVRRLHDSLYIADYELPFENSPHEYVALRPGESEPLFTFGDYPTTDLKDPDRYFAFKKANISNPNGSKFVALYLYHNMFKIFNSAGKTLKAIKILDTYHDESTNDGESNFVYRNTGWASESYIYLLGIYATSDVFDEDSDTTLKTSLEIWNWEGEPLYRTNFDRLIRLFTVSEKHGKLYGFTLYDTHHIYEYDMSAIMNSIRKD